MKYYDSDAESVLSALETTGEGLSAQEASRRLAQNGPNALAQAPKPSLLARFFGQLKDPMVIVLIVAALFSGITAI